LIHILSLHIKPVESKVDSTISWDIKFYQLTVYTDKRKAKVAFVCFSYRKEDQFHSNIAIYTSTILHFSFLSFITTEPFTYCCFVDL